MNNITKRNRLLEQYKSYEDYLPFCPSENKPKLMEEMLRINDEIKRIHTMTLSQLQTQVQEYFDTKKSKLNESKIESIITRDDVFRGEIKSFNERKTAGTSKRQTHILLNNVGCC